MHLNNYTTIAFIPFPYLHLKHVDLNYKIKKIFEIPNELKAVSFRAVT